MKSLKVLSLVVALLSSVAFAQQFGGQQMPPGSIQQQQQLQMQMQQQQQQMQMQQAQYQQPVMQPGAAQPMVAQGPGEQAAYTSGTAMACAPRGSVSANEGVIRGGVQVINTGGGSH